MTEAEKLRELENRLWKAADQLRANSSLAASQYSTPVLGLIFLRYADVRFTQAEKELASRGSGRRQTGKADYQARGGGIEEGDLPIEAKEVQGEELDEMLSDVEAYTKGFGVDLREGIGVSGFDWVAWLADAADAVLATDHRRKEFLARSD